MAVIDFHTHILPGIDDGSSSVKRSLAMLRKEAEQGIRKVVASPHFYPHQESPEGFLARWRKSAEQLREEMKNVPGLPEVMLGAEIYFFEGISDFESLREMAIEGTDYVMIEMPMRSWSNRNLQELAGIHHKLNLTPIIAHLDRYISPLHTYEIPERLSELPVLIQANAEFFTGWTRPLALRLFKEQKIHLLGSDCHNLDTRPPNMDLAIRALSRAFGMEALAEINRLEETILAHHS